MRLKKILSLILAIFSLVTVSTGLYSKASFGEEYSSDEKDAIDALVLLKIAPPTSKTPTSNLNKKKKIVCPRDYCYAFLSILNSEVTPIRGCGYDTAKKYYISRILDSCNDGFSNKCYDEFIYRIFKELKINNHIINNEDRELFFSACKISLDILNGCCESHISGQKRKRPDVGDGYIPERCINCFSCCSFIK